MGMPGIGPQNTTGNPAPQGGMGAANTNAATPQGPQAPPPAGTNDPNLYRILTMMMENQNRVQQTLMKDLKFTEKKFDGSEPAKSYVHLTNFKAHWNQLCTRNRVDDND